MASFRVLGPLQAGNTDPSYSRSACVAGFPPGPLGVNADGGRPLTRRARKTAAESAVSIASQRQFSELDSSVVNSSAVTPHTKAQAEEGVKLLAIRLLPAGTTLYRIGSTKKFGKGLPADANFASPWWMRKSEFERILAKGLQDTAWAARVLPAIATAWGTECDLQVSVETTVDLYAWIGDGKAIDYGGRAVRDSDSAAYWFPEKDLLQLYIPGLKESHQGHSRLWEFAFTARSIEPWLPIGTQKNLATGKSFVASADSQTILPPGKR